MTRPANKIRLEYEVVLALLIIFIHWSHQIAFGTSLAAEVIATDPQGSVILVSPDPTGKSWNPLEDVCMFRNDRLVACGKVVKTSQKGAEVQIVYEKEPVVIGDRVASKEVAPSNGTLDTTLHWGKHQPPRYCFTGGLSIGGEYTIPSLHFQTSLWKFFAVGISPQFLSFSTSDGGTNVVTKGIILTFQRYTQKYFRGFWGQIGLGPHFVDVTSGVESGQKLTLLVQATFGWRLQIFDSMTLGVAVGLIHLASPSVPNISVKTSSIVPTGMVDLGATF